MKEAQFDSAFTFIYSPREGTKAADMQEQVDINLKKDRLNRLSEIQKQISEEKNLVYKDRILEVLVEGTSKNNPNILSGRTKENKLVNFEGNTDLIGKLACVKIIEPKCWTLDGRAI